MLGTTVKLEGTNKARQGRQTWPPCSTPSTPPSSPSSRRLLLPRSPSCRLLTSEYCSHQRMVFWVKTPNHQQRESSITQLLPLVAAEPAGVLLPGNFQTHVYSSFTLIPSSCCWCTVSTHTQPLRDKFGQVYCLKVVVCTLWLRLV